MSGEYDDNNDRESLEHNAVDISEYDIGDFQVPKLPDAHVPVSSGISEDLQGDYTRAREVYYTLVQRGQDALENLIQVASQSEHPRAYEVVAQLIKTITETNDRIISLQEQMRKIEKQSLENQNIEGNSQAGKNNSYTQNNTILVGTMKDFQEMVKKASNQDYSDRGKPIEGSAQEDGED